MHTPESAAKISAKALERTSRPGYVHSQTGLRRSEETRALLRQRKEENPLTGEKNGMWGKHHTDKSRDQMSEKHADLLVKGLQRPYGRNSQKGIFVTKDNRSFYSKSGWELATMKWLDASADVTSWDYESVRIPYYYNDNKRWYVPDFLVTFTDGHREIWEVKPKEFIDNEKQNLKSDAAREFCSINGISEYKLLTGDLLREKSVL